MIWIPIDKNKEVSLTRQIYGQIRSMILNGNLKGGEKLPSTRSLASNLGISRNVVIEAYDQLLAEGYVESRHGSGTRVAEGLYLERDSSERFTKTPDPIGFKHPSSGYIDFRSGVPALDRFPHREWGQLLKQTWEDTPCCELGYNDSRGNMELRKAIAKFLHRARGIDCTAEQIVVTTGATQALALAARLLSANQGEALVEDPSNAGLLKVISLSGLSIHSIPVDENGMKTDRLEEIETANFVYVTPSHQFPLGGVLSIQRRLDLIHFAKRTGCFIIEDDYDSEFRYEGYPLSSLYELDPKRVIYIGSFSKVLAPALRIGYVILPDALAAPFLKLKKYTDVHTSILEQRVLAKFIEDGKFERHILKMKRIYRERRKAVIQCLEDHWKEKYRIHGVTTGLHLVVDIPGVDFSDIVVDNALKAGVKIYPVERHAVQKGNHSSKMIIGYGHLSCEEICEGIIKIKQAISEVLL